jgi:glycosyltransferase involved in cell wall biosynthesis
VSPYRALLLWVGRMVDVKRLDVLIAACGILQRQGVNFELCLAGDGPRHSSIRMAVQRAGLTDRVRFLGSVRHEHLPEWYRAADAVVLSSASEGLPNVLRESLACGTPFASTDVGSIGEIADPAWSRLSAPGDPAALAQAITRVLTHQCRSGAARYRARTWHACAAEITELFENLRSAGPRSFAIAGNEVLTVASVCPDEELAVAGPAQ